VASPEAPPAADRDGAEARLRTEVEALGARLAAVEQRLARLEGESAPAAPADAAPLPDVPWLPQGALALAGRTLLVLAGAYLVRALAHAGALPLALGAALGLVYAAALVLRAELDARAGRRSSAALHSTSAAAIAFPLVWEATARFALVGPLGAGVAVVALAAASLAVAHRHRLQGSAWLAALGACATVWALLLTNHRLTVALVALLALGALVEWLSLDGALAGLRWPVAAALDAAALATILIGARPDPPASYPPLTLTEAAGVLAALPVLYLASLAVRTLRQERPVAAFDAIQGTLAVVLGLVGLRDVLAARGGATELPGLLAALLAALCYAMAFARAERRPGQGRNFYFYSTAGAVLLLGGALLAGRLPLAWAPLGVLAVALGRRFDRTTLRAHGALALAAACVAAGLANAGVRAVAGLSPPELAASAWLSAAFALAAWIVLASDPRATSTARRLPGLLLALVVALSLAAALRPLLARALGSRLAADATTIAASRAAVVVVLVLGLAWLTRRGMPELVWLVYPLLGAGAVMLLADVRSASPAGLVASLGLYGAALLLVPRLLRADERPRR
jgi:hypothetical protein